MPETTPRTLLESGDHDGAALAQVMAQIITDARAAWPTVHLATDRFAAYLTERAPEDIALALALRHMHTSDLYLACACVDGDAGAVAAFERHCLAVVGRALARLDLDSDAVSEVKQRMRRALLVADAGPPRLAGFAGRSDLRRWIRVMAVNEALSLARQGRRLAPADDDRLIDLVAAGAGPELEYLKRTYRRELEIAFGAAVHALSDRERMLIRQHFIDGVTVQQIARLYRVHRATAGRWLERARETILTTTRARLMDRLHIPRSEIESIIRLVLSQLEINLRPLFGGRAPRTAPKR